MKVGPTLQGNAAHVGITIKISGRKYDCMIDDGSAITVISRQCYLSIPERERPRTKPIPVKLCSVDGSELINYGVADLTFSLGNNTYTEEVVVADITNDMILGLDFLKENHRCSVSYYENALEIDGQKYRTKAIKAISLAVCKVTLTEGGIIPPKSEVIFQGKLKNRGKTPVEGMVESARLSNAKQGLWAARSIVQVQENKVPLLLRNSTEEPVQVFKGQVAGLFLGLGRFSDFQPDPDSRFFSDEPDPDSRSRSSIF